MDAGRVPMLTSSCLIGRRGVGTPAIVVLVGVSEVRLRPLTTRCFVNEQDRTYVENCGVSPSS